MKKKALALAMYMACATPTIAVAKSYTNSLSGLNLGEVKSKSYLGEPFKGYIPILFTSKKQAKKLSVRLAPHSIFEQAGTEKLVELNQLHFRVSTRRSKPVIVVSSRHAMNLPIMNIILEIGTPSGVIYQDYTIMLDPPKHVVKRSKHKKHGKKLPKTYFSPRTLRKYTSRYRVRSGDTLSLIAKRNKRKGISLKRMMKSIYSSNPRAFSKHNINKLKAGAVLHIPSSKEIKNFSSIRAKTKKKYRTKKYAKSVNSSKASYINTYKVKRGDSLSKITKKFIYRGVSFTKMMRAIHKTNPHAFSRNRINVLKTGVRLRIPTYIEITTKKRHTKHVKKTRRVLKSVNISKTNLVSNTSNNLNTAETITNLQKRIRELRNELSSISDINNSEIKHNVKSTQEHTSKLKGTGTKQKIKTESLATFSRTHSKKLKVAKKTDNADEDPIKNYDIDVIPIEDYNAIPSNESNLEISEVETNDSSQLNYLIWMLIFGFAFFQYKKRKGYKAVSIDLEKPTPSFSTEKKKIKKQKRTLQDNKNELKQKVEPTEYKAAAKATSPALKTVTPIPEIRVTSAITPTYEIKEIPESIPSSIKNELIEDEISIKENRKTQEVHEEFTNEEGFSASALEECNLLIDQLLVELSNKPSEQTIQKHIDALSSDNFTNSSVNHINKDNDLINHQQKSELIEAIPIDEPSNDKLGQTIDNILSELENMTPLKGSKKTKQQKGQLAKIANKLC